MTWSYAEHAAERRAAGDGRSAAADLTHWRSVLGGPLPVLDLPADRPRPPVMTSNGRAVFRTLDAGLSRRLRELSRANRSTLFMTLLAGYAAMLHRVTGQEDIVVGTPVSDRPERAKGLIGFFVNTLALRFDLSGDPSFRTLLRRVRSVALDAYDHAGSPSRRWCGNCPQNAGPTVPRCSRCSPNSSRPSPSASISPVSRPPRWTPAPTKR